MVPTEVGDDLQCYIDGLRCEAGVGAGFVIYRDGIGVLHRKFKLPDYCSVYQAELVSLEQCLILVSRFDDRYAG